MALKGFKRVQSQDRVVNQVQDNVSEAFGQVIKASILDGRLIEDIDLVSGTPKTINHGLGRKLRGWIVVRKSVNANLWDSQDANSFPDRTLVLNTSATVRISAWVF